MSALRLARAFTRAVEDRQVRRAATTGTPTSSSSRRDRASRRSACPTRRASPRAPSRTRSPRRTTTSPRWSGSSSDARRSPPSSSSRSPGTWASCFRSRVPRGPARADRRRRGAARLRRGHDRLPRPSGRRTGALRRDARPDDARQGHRRRAAGGRLRRPAGDHGARRACRTRLPGRNALREPAGDGGGDRDAARARGARRRGTASSARGARLEAGLRVARRAASQVARASERCSACSSRTCPSRAGTTQGADTARFAAFHAAMLDRGVYLPRRSSRPASSRRHTAMPRSTRRSKPLAQRTPGPDPDLTPGVRSRHVCLVTAGVPLYPRPP